MILAKLAEHNKTMNSYVLLSLKELVKLGVFISYFAKKEGIQLKIDKNLVELFDKIGNYSEGGFIKFIKTSLDDRTLKFRNSNGYEDISTYLVYFLYRFSDCIDFSDIKQPNLAENQFLALMKLIKSEFEVFEYMKELVKDKQRVVRQGCFHTNFDHKTYETTIMDPNDKDHLNIWHNLYNIKFSTH